MPPPSRRLSEDLHALLEEARRRPLNVGEIEAILQNRGFALLTMLLAAPFLIPSVPGLSTPFGGAIVWIGICMARGRKPSLPRSVLTRELSPQVLGKILRLLLKLVCRMERAARPRLPWMQSGRGMQALTGLAIASGGSFLFLPIMVPVMNTLPTLSILLLTAGMLEADGLFILLGYLFGIAAWIYFGGWLVLAKTGAIWLHGLF